MQPSTSGHDTTFYSAAHDFSIGTQYNIGQQNILSSNLGLLNVLNPIPDASYTRNRKISPPDSSCLPGTRQDVIKKVSSWVDSSVFFKASHIMWLYGYVGCGKSAIAQAIAEKYAGKGRLAASYFFFRGSGERGKSGRFAATVASQVAAAIPSTARLIEAAVKTQVGLLDPSTSLSAQFQRLVFDPMKALKRDNLGLGVLRTPFLLVLDGLDECDDRDEIAGFIDGMVEFFTSHPRVPLKVLITSRVEEHLRTRLESPQVQLFNLVDVTSLEDIETALRASFALAAKHDRTIQTYGNWPSPQDLRQLVKHIGPSFIFMSTIVKFILDTAEDGLSPMERLPLALNINPGLDGLYARTLARSQHLPHFFDVVWTIARLRESLPILGIAHLLHLQSFAVVRVLMNLHAILQVPGDDISAPVTLCHNSLRDFLTTKSRSGVFYAPESHHLKLAHGCMAVLGGWVSPSPASEYARSYWIYHWRIIVKRLAELPREDRLRRHDEETKQLFLLWQWSFPWSFAFVLATYIHLKPNLVPYVNPVRGPFDPQGEQQAESSRLTLEELLQPALPAMSPMSMGQVTLMVNALATLRGDRLFDSIPELHRIWGNCGLDLPDLSTFHRSLLDVSSFQILQKLEHPYQAVTTCYPFYFRERQTGPYSRTAFSLCFLSWAEHLVGAMECERNRPTWESLSEPYASGYNLEKPFYAFRVELRKEPIVLVLMRFLVRYSSEPSRLAFVAKVKEAENYVDALQRPHGEPGLDVLANEWAWAYDQRTNWQFGFGGHGWNHEPSILNLLGAFIMLVRCIERRCGPWHGDSCPVWNAQDAEST